MSYLVITQDEVMHTYEVPEGHSDVPLPGLTCPVCGLPALHLDGGDPGSFMIPSSPSSVVCLDCGADENMMTELCDAEMAGPLLIEYHESEEV